MFGDPFAPSKKRKTSNSILGGGFNFGLVKKDNTKTNTKREAIPSFWKEKILMKQKHKCAGPDCAELHNGKKLPVNSISDFDHIVSLALGGKHTMSNIQALCPNCHRSKTREDRYKMSQAKKKKAIKEDKNKNSNSLLGGSMFGPATKRKKTNNPFDLSI